MKNTKIENIIIIRHGERRPNNCKHDAPLTHAGHKMSYLLPDNSSLKKILQKSNHEETVLIVSPFLRTLQTCCPLSQEFKLKLNIENGIKETTKCLPTEEDVQG